MRWIWVILAMWSSCSIAMAAPASPSDVFIAFQQTLSTHEAAAALRRFDDRDRLQSRYTPGRRGGLPLSEMDAATRVAAFKVLESVLSPRGLEVIEAIQKREAILGQLEGNPTYRDPELYYLAIFGTPHEARWGLRFEGHHLSINLTLSGDRIVSVLPLSLGSNPERISPSGQTLHTALFELAAQAIDTRQPEPFENLLAALLSVFPMADVKREIATLKSPLVNGQATRSGSGFQFSGQGASLTMSGLSRNHVHMTLSHPERDFGGR